MCFLRSQHSSGGDRVKIEERRVRIWHLNFSIFNLQSLFGGERTLSVSFAATSHKGRGKRPTVGCGKRTPGDGCPYGG